MKRTPFVWLGLALGTCHFLSSLLVVPLTLWIGESFVAGPAKNIIMGGLHFLTRILYFPILGLALYPRHWFPGLWITIPIVVNSLFLGMLLARVVIGLRRIR